MALEIARFQHLQLLEGGADAFVQGTLDTGIVPENSEAWEITLIEVQFSSTQLEGLSADHSIVISLSRDTKTSTIGFDDPDCVAIFGFSGALTTSGTYQNQLVQRWVPPAGTIFVEPTIYAQLDSNGTGVAVNCQMRLHYRLVKVNEIDILRLLQNS